MNDRWAFFIVTASAAALITTAATAGLEQALLGWQLALGTIAIAVGVIWILAHRSGHRSRLLEVLAVVMSSGAFATVASAIMIAAVDAPGGFQSVAPVDMPTALQWLNFFGGPFWVPPFALLVTLGLVLFPDGEFPSRRWRWMVPAAAVVTLVIMLEEALITVPGSTVIYSEAPGTVFGEVGWPLLLLMSLAGLSSLVVRYRASHGVVRHQIRWLGVGAAVLILAVVGPSAGFIATSTGLGQLATTLGIVAFFFCYGVAILRYRLFGVDVVINRSIVFGALALFITGVYVAVVVGIGELIGDRSNLWLAIGATALVAVVFEPVRARVQHWANVMVYGRRATPYEVLSGMNSQPDMGGYRFTESVRLLAAGTGAEIAAIWSGPRGDQTIAAVWPRATDPRECSGWDFEARMSHDGEEVGFVAIRKHRGDQLTDQDQRLITQFANQASLAVANALLNERLRERLDELAESRRRIVRAQDESRRRLERDLHDGAQQQLVGLKIKVGLARRLAEKEGADEIIPLLEGLEVDADGAVTTLRELARGIYPPLLEAEGLPTALRAQAAKVPISVDVEDRGVGRYDRETEAAVYFCVLEALNNIAKYAKAQSAVVTLEQNTSGLAFSVADDGVGFDPEGVQGGSGIRGMADRLDTIGGALKIESNSEGSVVSGSVPIPTGADATEPARTPEHVG